MLAETQDSRYFQRMAASLGDKARLLSRLEGPHILDVGAGGGELAEAIRLAGNKVWALDGSHAAINRMAEAYPQLHLLRGMAHEIEHMMEPRSASFNSIVCSSIFHEVYSYGTMETGPYSLDALSLTLQALRNVLAPNGLILLRDGIIPTDWDSQGLVRLNEDGERFWQEYERRAPFASWWGEGPRCVRLIKTEESGVYSGNRASLMEFLYTYTWGWDSAPREMKELYGIFTEENYREFFEVHGFKIEHSEQYLQPGYEEHLSKKVKLMNTDGSPAAYPSSNFLLVARRFN